MKIATITVFFLINASSAPERFADPVAFSIANNSGTHLLSLPMWHGDQVFMSRGYKPEAFRTALCPGNQVLEVSFERHQEPGPNDTGRQVSANFDQMEGDRFRILKGKVGGDSVCVLTTPEFLKAHPPVLVSRFDESNPCSEDIRNWLVASEKRELSRCEQLASFGHTILAAAEFQPANKAILAALALFGRKERVVLEMPAECQEGGGWRVDDGCEFDPWSVIPLLAWRNEDSGLEFVIEWAGPEGGDVILYRWSGGKMFERTRAYRYWMPI